MSGDLLYRDIDYLIYINNIFMENAKLTQEILALIDSLPFKHLKKTLRRLLRTNTVSRVIAKLAKRRI